jgi:hypothetical protein
VIACQVARHRVAIAGRVADGESGKPVEEAEVRVTEMPAAFKKSLELAALQYGKQWPLMIDRPDKTWTRADGLFYFLDLPNGKYSLRASLPNQRKRYGVAHEKATVSRDANGEVKVAWINLGLHPTTVKGKVTGTHHKNGVVMAEIRVKGSGERAFSDAEGQYVLSAIEPGKRTVLVLAQGYRPASKSVTLAQPGALETLNFALVREGG